jgi:hypothetical protein
MTTGDSTSGSRNLAEQYWTTMARTADLVRKLTALADRYDAAIAAGDREAADCGPRVALMRATAEAGRKLIRSRAPAAFPPREQPAVTDLERADRARSRDVSASSRDTAAQARDERATERDVRVRAVVQHGELDFSGRFLAACDRDSAAGDRADSLADRRAAQRDRDDSPPPVDLRTPARTYALLTGLEKRAVVRQAQGILMARTGLSAAEAFEALLLTATAPGTLDDVAAHVVDFGELPPLKVDDRHRHA